MVGTPVVRNHRLIIGNLQSGFGRRNIEFYLVAGKRAKNS
jgi:hypothetical protein